MVQRCSDFPGEYLQCCHGIVPEPCSKLQINERNIGEKRTIPAPIDSHQIKCDTQSDATALPRLGLVARADNR